MVVLLLLKQSQHGKQGSRRFHGRAQKQEALVARVSQRLPCGHVAATAHGYCRCRAAAAVATPQPMAQLRRRRSLVGHTTTMGNLMVLVNKYLYSTSY